MSKKEELRAVEAQLAKFTKIIVLEQVKVMDIATDNSCERTPMDKKILFYVKTNENDNNLNLISKEDEVMEKEIVLKQVKEIDIAADNSCLTSQVQ